MYYSVLNSPQLLSSLFISPFPLPHPRAQSLYISPLSFYLSFLSSIHIYLSHRSNAFHRSLPKYSCSCFPSEWFALIVPHPVPPFIHFRRQGNTYSPRHRINRGPQRTVLCLAGDSLLLKSISLTTISPSASASKGYMRSNFPVFSVRQRTQPSS